MRTLPPVGFIGLGIMGLPMARHIAEAGFPVKVYNRTASKAKAAAEFGAQATASPREAATGVRTLITMVTDPKALRDVMQGAKGCLSSPAPRLTWVQMSTIDVDSTREFARKAQENGWRYLDCPVVGSKKQVEAAELILLAGGEESVIKELRPVLYRVGKTIVHAGAIGSGTALKLCMNLIVAQMTTALAESIRLAEVAGVDRQKIFEVLHHSPALDCGYFRIKEEALMKRDFTPAFSLANMLKDVRFMTQEASKRATRLPVTEAVLKLLEAAAEDGHAAKDLSAIYLALAPTGIPAAAR